MTHAAHSANEPDGLSLRYSRRKLVFYALGGFAFAALAAVVTLMMVSEDNVWVGLIGGLVPLFGVLFFGAIGMVALARMLQDRVIVRIGDDGIYDLRIARDVIPWSAIEAIRVQDMQGQRFIMLDLEPEAERRLALTPSASFFKPLNGRLGFPGLCVNAAGLDGRFDDMVAAIQHYDMRYVAQAKRS